MSRTYEQLEPVISALDNRISAKSEQIDALDTRVTAVDGDLNNFYFSPSVKAGYWTVDETIGSQYPTEQEVYTEWIIPKGKTVQYMLTYPQENNAWLCAMYEFNGGEKQRIVYINNRNGASFDGSITIPSDVARMSLSYRTYGDCTFAIRGTFADGITSNDIARFESRYPFIENLELVETLVTTANSRSNKSAATLNGFYVIVPEMASDDYTYKVLVAPGTRLELLSVTSNVVYISNAKINFYISPSASAGHKLHIYKLSEGEAFTLLTSSTQRFYPLILPIEQYYQVMRINNLDDVSSNSSRVSSDVFNYYGKFKINLSDAVNYKVAIQSFSRETRAKTNDTSWQSDGYVFNVQPNLCFVVVVARTNNEIFSADDIPSGLVSIEAVEFASVTDVSNTDINLINARIDAIPTQELLALSGTVDANKIHALINLRNTSPIYDHLFVNDSINAKIPHESLYHLRLSKALGYRIIEANTKATSDGVIVVNHLSDGKFGNYFHHADGVTDISNIDVSTVTWAWIVENIRYNSSIPKYRTRPPRLEEFLEECNRQNMIPFVYSGTTGAVEMADKYMGHYNYICYGGNRTICPYGIIFTWNSSTTSKEQILATCDAIGSPMIYGLGNPQDFTDAELLEIIEALHTKGYAVGTSYQDTNWAKYRGMGFDFNGSQTMINRIEDGNICNYSTIFGWDDFNLTGSPTNDDNVLTFANSGTIVPKLSADTYPVSGYDFEIVFSGQIEVVTNGTGGTKTFTSDGSSPVFYACPVLNASPNITINVSANTVIYDLYFKAKRFY